jgi:IclR family pca regulon transcriptional regulator
MGDYRAPGPGLRRTERGPIARADFIEGMAKGMAVLESFDTHRQRLNATQAAERAGLTRASARRHLLTLVHLGYLESDGHWYWLTPKVLSLSGSYLASSRLSRILQPVLDRLAPGTGCAASAVVCDGDNAVVVARSTSLPGGQRTLVHGLYLGARLPLHATSTGKILLAAWSAQALDAWLAADGAGQPRTLARLTAHTITDPRRLRRLVSRVAKAGHCLSSEEHEPGVHAIAVPLADAQGRVHAALNLIAPPRASAPVDRLQQSLPLLKEAAGEIRALL